MPHRYLYVLAALFIVTSIPPLAAQNGTPGRYTMHKADDDFIRLDTLTGAVSYCRKSNNQWACDGVKSEVDELRSQIAALKSENGKLDDEVQRLRKLLDRNGPPSEPDSYAPGGGNTTPDGGPPAPRQSFRLPSEKEVDQALDYFENMMKKLQDRLKKLEGQQGSTQPAQPVPPAVAPKKAL